MANNIYYNRQKKLELRLQLLRLRHTLPILQMCDTVVGWKHNVGISTQTFQLKLL